MIWHILPIDDLEEHEEKSTCKCLPKSDVLDNGDLLIIHNSLDGREIIEKVIDVLNK